VFDQVITGSPETAPSLRIDVATRSANESHAYSFKAGSDALTVDHAGKGTLQAPATAIGSYGVVNLKITPVGPARTIRCNGQPSTKTQPVKLSGKFFLSTKSSGRHKWGSVGSKRQFTFAASNSITWNYAASCSNLSFPPCASSFSWSATGPGSSMYGAGATSGSVLASRTVQLSQAAGAIRADTVTFDATWSLKVAKNKSAVLHITAGAGGAGKTTMRSIGSGRSHRVACGKSGKQSATATSWQAKYVNGRPALLAKAKIFGGIKVKNTAGETFFERTTN
jgi:hypothetical protein